MTPEESFELMVMFFGLTNSLITFQTMINKILQVVKRLAENYLYVKPEKYKWKVKEVGFLGVVIGLERIKIKEEKVKGVLD